MSEEITTGTLDDVDEKQYTIRIRFIGRDRHKDYKVGNTNARAYLEANIRLGRFFTLSDGRYEYTINPAAIETYRIIEGTKVKENYR